MINLVQCKEQLLRLIYIPRGSVNNLINTNIAPAIDYFRYFLSIFIYHIHLINFIEFERR